MNSTQTSSLNNSTDGSLDTGWWKTFNLVSAGTLGILVVLAIVGNILTIAAVVKFRHLRERHYMLITSLAVADALVGVAWGIFIITVFRPFWCFFALDVMLVTFPTAASHFHVLLMAIDRFIAITFPFRYLTLMSEMGIKVSIAIVWIVAFVYVLTFLPWGLRDTPNRTCSADGPLFLYVISTQLLIYLMVFCSIVMIYSHINRVAKQQVNKIHPGNSTIEASIKPTHSSAVTIQDNTPDSQDLKLPVTPKATKFMIAVIVADLVTWTPYFLVALSGTIKPHLTLTSVIWEVFMRISIYLMLLNSCLNVFIYAAYIKSFRKAYKAIFCCSAT